MLDDTIYPVTIGADGQIVEIKIVNKYVRGNIHLTKVDSEYPDNKLTGATFVVYKDSNANSKLDDGDFQRKRKPATPSWRRVRQ